jgi:hypothetical protein
MKQMKNYVNSKHVSENWMQPCVEDLKVAIAHTYTANGIDFSKYTTEEWFLDVTLVTELEVLICI